MHQPPLRGAGRATPPPAQLTVTLLTLRVRGATKLPQTRWVMSPMTSSQVASTPRSPDATAGRTVLGLLQSPAQGLVPTGSSALLASGVPGPPSRGPASSVPVAPPRLAPSIAPSRASPSTVPIEPLCPVPVAPPRPVPVVPPRLMPATLVAPPRPVP